MSKDPPNTEGTSKVRPFPLAWAGALVAVLLLAFSFQGTRGLWEPDEGFYGNVAAAMAATGDWWIPRLNGAPFLDKPPLHYWGIAAGIALMGRDELGIRTANALWFTGTALLVGLLAARFWGRRAGPLATLAYAVMLAPFIAANVLTPDTVLTFWVTAMAYAYWRSHASAGRERFGWTVAAGVCAGMGLLAKGPALLVFGLPFAIHGLVAEGLGVFKRLDVYVAGVVAVAIAGSWYAAVAQLLPGAASYFYDNQVAGRLWSGHYQRNAGLTGPLRVYLPVMIVGGLPWCVLWPAQVARLARSLRSRGWSMLKDRPVLLMLVLWLVLPLAVLSLASSRLPLYVLPVMPVVALAATARLRHFDLASPAGRPRLLRLAAWVVVLIGIKAATAYWPAAQDTRRLAATLERLDVDVSTPIFAVDLKCNALPIYGYGELVQVRRRGEPYPFFSPVAALETVLAVDTVERVFLVRKEWAEALLAELQGEIGSSCSRLGSSEAAVVLRCGAAAMAALPVLHDERYPMSSGAPC